MVKLNKTVSLSSAIPTVGIVLLYLTAAIAFSIPYKDLLAENLLNENIPFQYSSQNFSEFQNCSAGRLNFSSPCISNVTLKGVGLKQIILYQVIPLRSNSSRRRPIVCCEGVSFNLQKEQGYTPIGCGHRHLGGIAYWGNVTGSPGVRCAGIPTATEVKYRFLPHVIQSDKYDIGTETFSDLPSFLND